jgi:hypothetical protein
MLHYGKDYIEACLKSIVDHCDKVIILYSLNPTHNHPEGGLHYWEPMEELKDIAAQFSKVEWVNVYGAQSEAEHINNIWKFTDGYDVLLRSDYDEIWDQESLSNSIIQCYQSPYRTHGIAGFINFWRSFNHVVAGSRIGGNYATEADFFRPIRLIHLREKNTSRQPDLNAKVYHMGYAIRERVMEYKIAMHGHKSEWRAGWIDTWKPWTPEVREGLFHPVSREIWVEIKDFDKNALPEMLKSHKYFNEQIIK